jgi:hypothetical protein
MIPVPGSRGSVFDRSYGVIITPLATVQNPVRKSPVFAELPSPKDISSTSTTPAITIRLGEAACDIYNGADPEVIKNTLAAVKDLC